jgi:hypothetical protein
MTSGADAVAVGTMVGIRVGVAVGTVVSLGPQLPSSREISRSGTKMKVNLIRTVFSPKSQFPRLYPSKKDIRSFAVLWRFGVQNEKRAFGNSEQPRVKAMKGTWKEIGFVPFICESTAKTFSKHEGHKGNKGNSRTL